MYPDIFENGDFFLRSCLHPHINDLFKNRPRVKMFKTPASRLKWAVEKGDLRRR